MAKRPVVLHRCGMREHSPFVRVGAVRVMIGSAVVASVVAGGGCGHSPTRDYATVRGVVFGAQAGDGERRVGLWAAEAPTVVAAAPTE